MQDTEKLEKAKNFLQALDMAHQEACAMLTASMWLLKSLNSMKNNIFDETKIYSFTEKKNVSHEIEPCAELETRNFKMIGESIDQLCQRLNNSLD